MRRPKKPQRPHIKPFLPGPALLASEAKRAAMSDKDRLRELGNRLVKQDSESPEGALMLRVAERLEQLETPALLGIAAKRMRQILVEGFDAAHDDQHDRGELALAAACYALATTDCTDKSLVHESLWPFERKWWKPKGRRHNLEVAGALLAAELDRLQRIDEGGIDALDTR